MDLERRKPEQMDLPGMPEESKKRRTKINTKKGKPVISGDDIISQKEMRDIWNKKMAEKKGIKTLWVELIFADSGGRGKSNDEISLDSTGIFRINNNERKIKYDEVEKHIKANFISEKAEEILRGIERLVRENFEPEKAEEILKK